MKCQQNSFMCSYLLNFLGQQVCRGTKIQETHDFYIMYFYHYYIFFTFFLSNLVSPESVVVPIVSCIFGFPLFALLIICCLRRRAKLARERERQLNYGLQDHAVSLVRFSPIHKFSKYYLKRRNTKLSYCYIV